MSKLKSVFHCTECGHESVKWIGCCPGCSTWNSFTEKKIAVATTKQSFTQYINPEKTGTPILLRDILSSEKPRMLSGIDEWDRVVGGGIIPGSFIVITGDPGVGKSTLLLQVAEGLAQNHVIQYFSSEESLTQVKQRAIRLNVTSENIFFSDEAGLEAIVEHIKRQKPDVVILDSIQNCFLLSQPQAFPGTVAQLREAAFFLMRVAKEQEISIIITGHITKDGQMAGPKLLEHMVDAVFYLQGEDRWQTRILRSQKNRFGTINEIGFFEMEEKGLVPVSNINQQLLDQTSESPGSALVCTIEGTRPLLLELQALTVESKFGMPQRVVTGVDSKTVVLIAAILEKYLHIPFSRQDIFFKVSGGVKMKDAGSDMGIALALLSSYFQKPLPLHSLALGELTLTGQLKSSTHMKTRMKEAEKFGIKQLLVADTVASNSDVKKYGFKNVYQLLSLFPEQESEQAQPSKRVQP
ncbi:DNA repair protein RadA [Candidatus Babeliales bacterium]|nr:DNA repair protein RadA [Candidatus Babeliales bacterium]